jgi:hypothetical protein
MKVLGWIFLVLGSLSFLGTMLGGNPSVGPIFWVVLGLFLISRAKRRKKEEEEKEKWVNGKK